MALRTAPAHASSPLVTFALPRVSSPMVYVTALQRMLAAPPQEKPYGQAVDRASCGFLERPSGILCAAPWRSERVAAV